MGDRDALAYLWARHPEIAADSVYPEPFPSCLCPVNLQCVDGLGKLAGAPGAAAEPGEDLP